MENQVRYALGMCIDIFIRRSCDRLLFPRFVKFRVTTVYVVYSGIIYLEEIFIDLQFQ